MQTLIALALALVIPRPDNLKPHRYFGDRTVSVPLAVYALEPEALTIRADLVQLTSNLSVPIGAEVEVPLVENSFQLDLSVPLPAVERETDFELRIWARRNHDGPWHAAGLVALRAYPGDLLKPVRAWAKSHPLRVEDDNGSLNQFLQQQGIPVAGAGTTKRRGVALYAGETTVLFTERKTEIPRFVIDRTSEGTVVRIETQLLDRLATDPLAQKMLLEVFQLLEEERSATKGDVQ